MRGRENVYTYEQYLLREKPYIYVGERLFGDNIEVLSKRT